MPFPLTRLRILEPGSSTALATGQAYLGFMGFFFGMIGFKMAVDGVLRGAESGEFEHSCDHSHDAGTEIWH